MSSKLAPELSSARPLPSWDNLTFSLTETDFMYRSLGDKRRDPVWDRGEILPFQDIKISPAAAFMSYGLGVFEGLKAQRTADDRVLLFRPEKNGERFQKSAQRLLLAPFPVDQFVEAVEELVRRNLRFVPPADKGSFYIRPLEHAIEPKLGLGPCNVFSVILFGSPVGSYFAGSYPAGSGSAPLEGRGVRLQVLEQGRVAPGGTGFAKAMGNYGGGIYLAYQWKQKGFDDVLYLDARDVRNITETSGSNVFLKKKNGGLVTPPLDDQILPGVTRDSTMEAARKVLGLKVEERALSIDEAIEEGEELFCTGTAWTLQSVREIVYRDRLYRFPMESTRKALLDVIRGIQTGVREDIFGWTREVR